MQSTEVGNAPHAIPNRRLYFVLVSEVQNILVHVLAISKFAE